MPLRTWSSFLSVTTILRKCSSFPSFRSSQQLHKVKYRCFSDTTNSNKISSIEKVIKNFDASNSETDQSSLLVAGWVQSVRKHGKLIFVHVSDGSSAQLLQIVIPKDIFPKGVTYGSSVSVQGKVVGSSHAGQDLELQADSVSLIGHCDPVKYPFKARQQHDPEYWRQFLHLRCRPPAFSSLLRLRAAASAATHSFFREEGYLQVDTPILTASDCEGAGEVFRVEAADMLFDASSESKARDTGGKTSRYFFHKPAYLSVSGQLHLEAVNGSFSRVYTFSPAFRADPSTTNYHLAEFYMIEAELAFIQDLGDLCQVMKGLVKHVTEALLNDHAKDLAIVHQYFHGSEMSLDHLLRDKFPRISYDDAVRLLEKENDSFEVPVKWGSDLRKEHEKRLVSYCGNVPCFLTDFPADLKPFYCRGADNEGGTAAAVDLLTSTCGELCGGSLREERYDILHERLSRLGLLQDYAWYLELRQFGTTPHGGFGLGFERLLQCITGVQNIRDIIPFPRYMSNCRL